MIFDFVGAAHWDILKGYAQMQAEAQAAANHAYWAQVAADAEIAKEKARSEGGATIDGSCEEVPEIKSIGHGQ